MLLTGAQERTLLASVAARLEPCFDRLRAAQGYTRTAQGQDFIEASVIDARLRQITAQIITQPPNSQTRHSRHP